MRTVRCALQSELYTKAGSMATAWPAAGTGEDAAAKVGFFFFGDMLGARRAGWTPLKVAQRQFKAYGGALNRDGSSGHPLSLS